MVEEHQTTAARSSNFATMLKNYISLFEIALKV
jgi:hypothetical protein